MSESTPDTTTEAPSNDYIRANIRRHQTAPVTLFWTFSEEAENGEAPKLTTGTEEDTELVLDAYGVESVGELADEAGGSYRNLNTLRLGILVDGEERTFYDDETLLVTVEGITEELAAAFLDECNDIPTLCERRRQNGTAFLGELLHDARVEDREWVPELEDFIDDLDEDFDNLESRLKEAGVWVEPENVTAEGY